MVAQQRIHLPSNQIEPDRTEPAVSAPQVSAIRYHPTIVPFLAYQEARSEVPIGGKGCLLTTPEGPNNTPWALGVSWYSSLWSDQTLKQFHWKMDHNQFRRLVGNTYTPSGHCSLFLQTCIHTGQATATLMQVGQEQYSPSSCRVKPPQARKVQINALPTTTHIYILIYPL